MGVILYPLSVDRCPLFVVRCPLSVVRRSLSRALPFAGGGQGVALRWLSFVPCPGRCPFPVGDVQGVSLCWLASPFRGGWRGLLFLLFFDLAFFYEFSGVSKFCKAGCKFFNCCFFRVVSDGDGACVDVCLE